MPDLPKIHPREEIVIKAQRKLTVFLGELTEDLTPAEKMRVVTSVLTEEWQEMIKYWIREERHPEDPDKPGGLL